MSDPPPSTSPPRPSGRSGEPQRPGTSGTEALLTNNRRRASVRLRDARRKEMAYKTRKRSAAARADAAAASSHFREGLAHHTACLGLGLRVLGSVGYLFRDRRERRRQLAEERSRARAADKKRKTEGPEAVDGDDDGAGEGEGGGEGEGEGTGETEGTGEADADAAS